MDTTERAWIERHALIQAHKHMADAVSMIHRQAWVHRFQRLLVTLKQLNYIIRVDPSGADFYYMNWQRAVNSGKLWSFVSAIWPSAR